MIVVDTNVIAYAVIPGTMKGLADEALRRDASWQAPLLWRSEFRNVLLLHIRRKEFSIEESEAMMARAGALLTDAEHHVATRSVLVLAERSGCTAYDCEFVALAERLGVRLVTSDRQVLREFPGVAVSLETFATTGGEGLSTRGRAPRP